MEKLVLDDEYDVQTVLMFNEEVDLFRIMLMSTVNFNEVMVAQLDSNSLVKVRDWADKILKEQK